MRYRVLVLALLTGLGVASCGENNPPANNGAGNLANGAPLAPALVPATPQAAPGAAPPIAPQAGTARAGGPAVANFAKPSVPVVSQDPIPPADAQWTIFCYSVGGVTHVEDARNLKAALVQRTNRRDWYVMHSRDQSHLYFGYYRVINGPTSAADQKEVARARADKEMIQDVEDARQEKPFRLSAFVQLSSPDPTSRPEWNLANVDLNKHPADPTRAYWSIQIAAFRDHPKRKEAAVQAVEGLRQHNIPAYYYHGENISSVCVGAWPPAAVRESTTDPELKDTAGIDPRKADSVVVTSEQLHPNLVPRRRDGAQKVVAVAPQLDIVDKQMKAMTLQFPEHQVNYEQVKRKRKDGGYEPESSFLVAIPRAKGNGLYDHDDVPPAPAVAERPGQDVPAAFVNPTTPGAGGARQVGAIDGSTLGGATLTNPPGGRQPADPGAGRLQPAGDR